MPNFLIYIYKWKYYQDKYEDKVDGDDNDDDDDDENKLPYKDDLNKMQNNRTIKNQKRTKKIQKKMKKILNINRLKRNR